MIKENEKIACIDLYFSEDYTIKVKNTCEIFSGKRVLLFCMPGAFLPVCSERHLPEIEQKYSEFLKYNIDEVYCLTINDPFVLEEWKTKLNINNVKMLSDGNFAFTFYNGQIHRKTDIGCGERSWRHAMVINDLVVEKLFEEEGKTTTTILDPYVVTTPKNIISYLEDNSNG